VAGLGGGGQRDEQEIGAGCEFDRVRDEGPPGSSLGLRGAARIGDIHVEAGKAARDLEADAPEPEDACAHAMDPPLQRIETFRLPVAAADPALAADHAPGGREHHRDTEVRHIARQHVRRVGDAQRALAGCGKVHRIVADAVDGDDLELRQGLDHGPAGAQFAARGDPADVGAMLG
jgi:hypothetical protein